MTTFLRFLSEKNKDQVLLGGCASVRDGSADSRIFEVSPESFRAVPGAPFAYWVSGAVRASFANLSPLTDDGRTAKVGVQTGDDFRFVRTWWERPSKKDTWVAFAKGGAYSPYYAAQNLVVNWRNSGNEIKNLFDIRTGALRSRPQNIDYCFLPGLTWSDRTTKSLSARIWQAGGVFSVKGSCGFFPGEEFFAAALMNSQPFNYILSLLVGAGDAAARSYQVGTIGKVPYPEFDPRLDSFARHSWSLKRNLDTIVETSHAFLLPAALRARLGDYAVD
jgi:hypothetical protein